MRKKYLIQTRLIKGGDGFQHQQCYCTLPYGAIAAMGLDKDNPEEREVIVEYDRATETITIKKAKKA